MLYYVDSSPKENGLRRKAQAVCATGLPNRDLVYARTFLTVTAAAATSASAIITKPTTVPEG